MANSLPASIAPAVEQLTSAAPPMFLLGLVERFMAVGVQIALSVIVFYAVFTHRKWLYPAAIGLHAITDTLPALMQTGYFSSISIVLGWVALCMAGIGYLAWKTHCRCKFSIENIA
jgi:uncharacterized membrane protein YhfC